ncbi:HD-GYP domain-containing protein [bacterium]|nr:HD-GYP domain-containing protein [bacterium]
MKKTEYRTLVLVPDVEQDKVLSNLYGVDFNITLRTDFEQDMNTKYDILLTNTPESHEGKHDFLEEQAMIIYYSIEDLPFITSTHFLHDKSYTKVFRVELLERFITNFFNNVLIPQIDNIPFETYHARGRVLSFLYNIVNSFSNMIEAKSYYTWVHSKRVGRISYKIGVELGLPEEKLEELIIGALIHDLGKVAISEKILIKPDNLDMQEFNQIKEHPLIGYYMVNSFKCLTELTPYILYHHERYDGCGYPFGLKGTRIPFESRITSIADAIESMVSSRPYRSGMSLQKIKNELENNSGTQFDPDIVKSTLSLIKENVFDDVFLQNLNYHF